MVVVIGLVIYFYNKSITVESSAGKISKPFSIEITAKSKPTWMSVEADGKLVYSGVMNIQQPNTFDVKEIVAITSGNGNETFVKINGKDMGVLSSDSGVVRDVEYTSNGKETPKK